MRRVGFWVCLVGVAVVTGAAFSYKPWQAYLDQRQMSQRHQEEMNDAEKRRAELAKERAELESRAGQERLAREHNYIRPGEQSGP